MSQKSVIKTIMKHVDGMTVNDALLELKEINKICKRTLLTFSVADTTRGKK